MAQAHSALRGSDPSVEQVANQFNTIAERAVERLKAPVAEPPPKPAPMQPGIYFGLDMGAYHAASNLGSSDIKRLLRSPADYWWESHFNPDRPASRDSSAMLKGRALHSLCLEGEKAFAAAFAEEPTPESHPGCLVTLDDLKAKCRTLGDPVSGTKADLAKRIKAKDPKAMIFDEIIQTFRAMCGPEVEILKPDVMRSVRRAAARAYFVASSIRPAAS